MNKTKHLDIIQIVAAILLFLCIASILLMTNGVNSIVEKEYFFPDELSEDISSPAGKLVQDVMQNYHILMRYPGDAWFGESFLLIVELIPNEDISAVTAYENEEQALFLEAALMMDAVEVRPGKKILVPLQFYQPAKLQWEVQPVSGAPKTGKIWITIYPAAQDGLWAAYDPVMLLPVNVNIHTIFGMKVGVGRWISTLVGLGCAGIILLRRHKRTKNFE